MKNAFYISLFLLIANYIFAIGFDVASKARLPNKGYIKAELLVESFDIISDENSQQEVNKLTSCIKSIFSLSDERCVLEFTPFQIMHYPSKNSLTPNITEDELTLVFDGTKWLEFNYSTKNLTSGRLIKTNNVVLKNKRPIVLGISMGDYYTSKIFFLNFFEFFKTPNESVGLEQILGKNTTFPPWDIKFDNNSIYISADTISNKYDSKIRIEDNIPYIETYSRLFKGNSETKGSNLNIRFNEKIKVNNLELYIPKIVARTYIDLHKNTGFKIIVTLKSIEYVSDLDFEKFIPIIPVGYRIIDEEKGISYIKSESKADILKSIKEL